MGRIRDLRLLEHTRNEEEHQRIGKLILYKNALTFNHTVFQVSNICSLWTTDHSHEIRHSFPGWIIPSLVGGLILAGSGALSNQFLVAAAGVVAVLLAARAWWRFVPTTPIAQFALTIELNSGKKSSFMSTDRTFVAKAAHVVSEAIASKSELSQRVEMNFDNRTINIENASHNNIIAGDVFDSQLGA